MSEECVRACEECWSFHAALFGSLLDPPQGTKKVRVLETQIFCFAVLRPRFSSFCFVVRTLNKPTEAPLFFQPSALTIVNKELSLSTRLPSMPSTYVCSSPMVPRRRALIPFICGTSFSVSVPGRKGPEGPHSSKGKVNQSKQNLIFHNPHYVGKKIWLLWPPLCLVGLCKHHRGVMGAGRGVGWGGGTLRHVASL